MSSFKNAAQNQRRTHRERSQPAHRKKFGLLEKHKDYIKRAKDYNRKKSAIKNLKNVAEQKNADEFYRGMIKSKLVSGVHRQIQNNDLGADVLKLLKTQDLNYLSIKLEAEKKKVSKLKQVLHGTEEPKCNMRTIFVDSDSDIDAVDLSNFEESPLPAILNKKINKLKSQQYSLLQLREERVSSLQDAYDKLKVRYCRMFLFHSAIIILTLLQ